VKSTEAVSALGALAQEHRLALFRLLVQAGADGMAAGAIIYRADYAAMNDLMAYLMENCCGGAGCAADSLCGPEAAPNPAKRKTG